MWLDAQQMEYTPEGHFVVQLSEPIAAHFRYRSWAQGLGCECREQERWLPEDSDLGISLLDAAALAGGDSPLGRFVGEIPAPVREAVQPFYYQQTRLLQWLTRSPHARELFSHSPNLCWLLIVGSGEEEWPNARVDELLRQSRRQILKALTGSGSKALVRLLGKVQLCKADLKEYRLICQALAQPEQLQPLSTWAEIPVNLLLVATDFPQLIQGRLIRPMVLTRDLTPEAMRARIRRYGRYWQDALNVARLLGMTDARIALERCEDPQALKALHDRWTDRLNRQRFIAVHGKVEFPPPPVPGNAHIHPILTMEDLQEEGRLMRHCVASYAHNIISGECYIYRIMQPQRATIEVAFQNGEPVIRQVSLARNQKPDEQTWAAIRHWLRPDERGHMRLIG
ncbi:hypothetical protein HNR62_000465 [Oceanisphaera litoralis]|uniref:PcfJ domain-containing protein n=1 Tax=Oceanisphaera litoralis TaxID=225144 RepID=UPI0019569BBD|nr:PcfJ domain-containing protein [Oceanisphaera litoralis]MBM7454636.1 hypothetical protein [Oceanisphaera litoralis]